MAKKYAISDVTQTTNTTTAKTMGIVIGGTTARPAVYDFIVGAPGTPADNAMRYGLQRSTTTGTTTAKTPNPLDSADMACVSTAGVDATIEPTLTAATINVVIAANQRATFRWVAAPDGEFRGPATASNGIAATSLSPAYTGATFATVHFME
jgi:hypothetical protein